ncbi:NAD(P)-dependent oxidoreductase [Paremcibacter congregatus]|uniref:NAD(P)-dependent oxidoreductase n=1 Tax=Paremcibacter congregatus TaxID=2043170 RepID=UPI003A90829C
MTTHARKVAQTPAKTDHNCRLTFDDLHKPLDGLTARTAASHCLYCYEAPCIQACPTSIDIPTFIHQIGTGNIDGAARTILSENIMGGTCARACPTEVLCEQACVHNTDHSDPVEIGLLQRYATDHLMDQNGPHPFMRAPDSGRHIAVVGAGPAGLSCAHRAALLGHQVTVYEARPKAGGLNEYGLAAYKMINDFAAREVDFLLGVGGIDIRYGQALGRDITLDDLQAQYDAVFLGVGLGATNALGLDGEDMPGVQDAIQFIENIRQADDPATVPLGNDILVIGGGNTAIDAAVQARKLGAKRVTLAYRRGPDQMGATDFEVDLARKNDVHVMLWTKPKALIGADRLTAVTLEGTRLEKGKLTGTGETIDLPCDHLLKAIGQKLSETTLSGLDIASGKLVSSNLYQTSRPGVFAGGDCIKSGEDLTVQAVEDGKQAALAINLWLASTRETSHG